MVTLVIRSFAGMAPSANPKNLNANIATYARNVIPRYGDVRPFPVAEDIGIATPGNTLYRFETFGYFITRPGEVNFVRGPIPTDTTERTYYTGDGAPKVTDVTGAIRQLGVPKPAAAPSVVVNLVPQYGETEAANALGTKLSELTGIVWANCQNPYVGITDAEMVSHFTPGPQPWTFNFIMAGTMVGGGFSPTNPNHHNLMDESLGYFVDNYLGAPTGFVPVYLRGTVVVLASGLATALAAIKDPSDLTGVKQLLTSDQITAIVADLTNSLIPADAARDATIGRLRLLKDEFIILSDSGSEATASNIIAVEAFYARTDIADNIYDQIKAVAALVLNAMVTYNASA